MTQSPGPYTRRQASLYLSGVDQIEEMRSCYNPVQAQLIPAHVTLCREDEVGDWSAFQTRTSNALPIDITIGFGSPVRDGHLVFMPAVSGIEQFDKLRSTLLGKESGRPRKQLPHITIIHPRNGKCTDAAFEAIAGRLQPFTITIRKIFLIEQIDGGPWIPFAEFGSVANGPPAGPTDEQAVVHDSAGPRRMAVDSRLGPGR